MKEISSLNEISKQGKSLLFIYGENCGWSKKSEPMVEAFEESHPEINCYKANRGSSAEFVDFSTGTPTFGLFKNGELISKFGDGRTTFDQMELAWSEKYQGIKEVTSLDPVKKSIKTAVLFNKKSTECGDCEEMEKIMDQYAFENAEKVQVFKIKNTPEIKQELGLSPEPVDFPVITVFHRGEQSKDISFGKKGIKFITYFVINALSNLPSSGNCKG